MKGVLLSLLTHQNIRELDSPAFARHLEELKCNSN